MLKTTKRPINTSHNYGIKRRKLRDTSVYTIQKYLASGKGEVIQALYMVFDSESFSFETLQKNEQPCKFITFLNLEGFTFIGYGNTKISSRSSASRTALLHLLDNLELNSERMDSKPETDVPVVIENCLVSDDLSDMIASLVLSKYDELRNANNKNLPWFKMISGIVMIRDNDYRNGKVLVLSTGSKCIESKNIQTNGCVILDSHAEILSRRAFQYFLYTQIELSENRSESILRHNGKKYEIDKNISLYLFISSAPCGDCRIFAVSKKDNFIDRHPNRLCRGLLRMKLDGGNSTVPVTNYETDPRLTIMSCSDKLLKMNVLGLQGSLLSNFVEPVYITGVIIGDSFQQSHVSRALHDRIEKNDFQEPFHLNKITIGCVSKPIQLISKPPKSSVNWICENSVEITNSSNGKTVDGSPSRLCKYNFLDKFLKIQMVGKKENDLRQTYEYFKSISSDYRRTKQIFYNLLEAKNFGKWVSKNRVFNKFSLLPGL